MRSKTEHPTPGQVFARRVQAARKRLGWTQQQLAERVTELGVPMHRLTVAKIEKGGQRAENVALREMFGLALALSVAPVHLLVPLEDEASVDIAPATFGPQPAPLVRSWIRGQNTLYSDPAQYLAEMPESEQLALFTSIHESGLGPVDRGLVSETTARRVDEALRAIRKEEEDDG